MQKKHLFRTLLLIFIATVFLVDIFRMITDVAGIAGSNYHQKSINVAFRSAFGLFELILIGVMLHYIRKYPRRRIRCMSLLFFHVVGVIMLPMITRSASWMALSFPWPQTLLAFDRSTPRTVLLLSLTVSFLIVPIITLIWGRKAFCGFVCPLGGFYSETLGRLFNPQPGKLLLLRRIGPPATFLCMSIALATILLIPVTLTPIRAVHKQLFFLLSQVLYFTIGIPFIGARSYCTHICPLGYEIGMVVKLKRRFGKAAHK